MIIEANKLSKKYKKVKFKGLFKKEYSESLAVKDVNLSIKKNEHIGLVGLNGSGKSTLIKMILGILQPSEGSIKTFGLDPIKYRQKIAMHIGIVFGQRSQLRWDLPPIDTLKLNKEIYQIPNEVFEKRLTKLTTLLNVENFLFQPVRTLSLGQRMKAEFITALIHDPDLIILDEPTIGLDVVTKNSIVNFLKTLTKKTIIFTSHNLEEVENICSRVLILNKGELILNKEIKDLDNLDTPTTIKFTSQENLQEISKYVSNVQKISEDSYEISNIKKNEVKKILSSITSEVNIQHIEVKRSKLEYLLEQTAKKSGEL
ncbi:ATP-binding cassette domain-containing protein [Lactobacillus helveticus]|uniref:ATP-binding cassette domain-containing protein n=1 Tax=Lactobacillus helveticus TaxID=1587 RepID=UPI000933BA69|nr:ATP-binding cassette domain-containing protein [Lactobacillus helveticus]